MKCFLSGMPDLKLGLNDKLGSRQGDASQRRAATGIQEVPSKTILGLVLLDTVSAFMAVCASMWPFGSFS